MNPAYRESVEPWPKVADGSDFTEIQNNVAYVMLKRSSEGARTHSTKKRDEGGDGVSGLNSNKDAGSRRRLEGLESRSEKTPMKSQPRRLKKTTSADVATTIRPEIQPPDHTLKNEALQSTPTLFLTHTETA